MIASLVHRTLPLATLAASLTGPLSAQTVGCLWDRHADSPIARFEAGTLPIDGQLYCFGGFFNQAIHATPRVDAYDPLTDSWSQKADMPDPTTHVGFAREGRNVWVIGGFVGDNPGVATADVWIYDIDANTWSAGPSMPRPIAGGGVAVLGRNLHYFGGCEADRVNVTGDHWVVDLDDLASGWQPLATMPEPRCHLAGAALGGEAWAVGGQYGHDMNPMDTRWVHIYDPVADSWSQGPLLPEPRSHFEPGTFVENGNLYIAGGKNLPFGPEILAGTLELDPVLGEWHFLPPLPNPRYGAGVQLLGGRLYAANGASLSNNPQTDLYSRDWNESLPVPFRINCGGPEVAAASGNGCWCGDMGFRNGTSTAFNPNAPVANTLDDEVFHRQRQGTSGNSDPVRYRLALGNGYFRVRFFMAERAFGTAGNRVLNLEIEDEVVAEGLDLAADPGFEVALERGFEVHVTDTLLDIAIRPEAGQRAIIAAMEIESLGPLHFEYECGNGPNGTGQPSLMDYVGTSSIAANDLELTAGPIPAGQFGLFVQSETAASIPLMGGGTLCVGMPFFRLPVEFAPAGVLRHDLDIGSPPGGMGAQIMAGSTWRFQAWHRDTIAPGFGLSNAVKIVFTP